MQTGALASLAMITLLDLMASGPFRSISYISYHVRTAVVCTAIAPYPATMTQPRMTSDKVLATLTFDTASGRPPLHFLLSNDGKTVISVGRAPKSDAQLQSVR